MLEIAHRVCFSARQRMFKVSVFEAATASPLLIESSSGGCMHWSTNTGNCVDTERKQFLQAF